MVLDVDAADNQWMRLIERKSQLAALQQYAREASQGQGRLVLISGEAGVGKSVLLEKFAQELDDARWLWAGCDGLFTPAALGPLLDIANQIDGELLRLCHAEAKRDQLYGALQRQLGDLQTLTVLAIEDVHWADEATLDLLSYLGRRIQHLPVLLLVTYRDDALVANDPLRLTLGALASQRATRRLSLPTLSAAGVATLAQGTGIDATDLHRLTAGNPFFVTEVLQAGSDALPASVRDAVLARTRTLSTPARDALEVAALVGSRMQSELLMSLVEDPLVMDELISHGLLIKGGDELRFRHEIARVAIEAAVAPYRKAAIHTKILDALLSSGCEDDARLAFHAEGADRRDLVLWYGRRAGRRASELWSHTEAAAQYQRALRSAPDGDIQTRAELSDALAHELALLDRWEESAEIRTAALELWRTAGDLGHESRSMRELSKAMWRLCHGPESVQASEAALSIVAPLGPSPELAWAYERLAYHRMSNGRHMEAIALARQAREIAGPLGLPAVISGALNTEAESVQGLGGDWAGLIQGALDVALAAEDEVQAGRAFANMYMMYSTDLRHDEGEQCYTRALTYCEEHEIGTYAACLQGERTRVWEKLGRWNESAALSHVLLHQHTLSPVNRLNPLCSLAKIMARRGQDGFWPYLDEAIDSAIGIDEPEWLVPAGLARTEAYWLEGHVDAATSELSRVRDVSAGVPLAQRGWVALWTRRLTGATDAIDLEPFTTQLVGDETRAAELWDRLGYRYEAALALLDTNDEALLRESLARLSDLGAEAAARLVRQRMRDLGIRSIPTGARAAARTHPRGLTAREQEILELLSQGQSNEEISASLFISVRTVEHHVSAILGKLGATTRKDAAKEALKLGLIHADRVPVSVSGTTKSR
jgi:DNA-binding CsgD family transcriptional regulator/tetratricopeptide (TPR) repeat protein